MDYVDEDSAEHIRQGDRGGVESSNGCSGLLAHQGMFLFSVCTDEFAHVFLEKIPGTKI
jgi:hypothetical protein